MPCRTARSSSRHWWRAATGAKLRQFRWQSDFDILRRAENDVAIRHKHLAPQKFMSAASPSRKRLAARLAPEPQQELLLLRQSDKSSRRRVPQNPTPKRGLLLSVQRATSSS